MQMEQLFVKLVEILMIALVTSVFAQQVIEGILKSFYIQNKIAIKLTVVLIECWLVYYVAYFLMIIVEWPHLITITLLVFAGAEVINSIIKKFQDIRGDNNGTNTIIR